METDKKTTPIPDSTPAAPAKKDAPAKPEQPAPSLPSAAKAQDAPKQTEPSGKPAPDQQPKPDAEKRHAPKEPPADHVKLEQQKSLLRELDKNAADIAGSKQKPQKQKAEPPRPPAPKQKKDALPRAPVDAPRANKQEKIVYIKLGELHPFQNHPFSVRDDAEMRALVESVRDKGVHQPALVRPRPEGGYELVAGHRRQRASEIAGFKDMPCIVRDMTDDEAVLAMTDDNLRQRAEILPSEKAVSLKMQVEAIKHQGARNADPEQVGKRSVDIVGERNNMNAKQVQRYMRLTELVPDLLGAVDEKRIGFTPAVELSFINPKNQNLIAVSVEGQDSGPSLSQAQRMRELDQKNQLNGDAIDGILCEQKKEADKVIINGAELEKYFGKDKTPRQMKEQIISLLDDWKDNQKGIETPTKKPDLEK